MKNEGKTLEDLMKLSDEAEVVDIANESQLPVKSRNKIPTKPLNVDLPETVMRDLKMISAHKDVTIREIVETELTRFIKREKKKMLEELTGR